MTSPEYTDNLPPDLFPTFPVCWATLSDVETEDALEELDDWVTWLVDRYSLDHRAVPPCWEQHGALVEELSALRTAWISAFNITGRPEAPLEWHAHFAAALRRLIDWASRTGCRTGGQHRPDR
ncbi:hypothetical protein [Sporichthya sp.]|uniref:hypothetical protein n=1 Tax=Sporichthya sp. TaxID=65475 RepID=UPI0017962D81|nr:hypothetical protein [Sporichthya sp.]MBA3743173.1 hypothetical protein [Sporichthya sp.]